MNTIKNCMVYRRCPTKQMAVAANCALEKKNLDQLSTSKFRAKPDLYWPCRTLAHSAAAMMTRTMTKLHTGLASKPNTASAQKSVINTKLRHAKIRECNRYSGQMRYPLEMRRFGILSKRKELRLRARCSSIVGIDKRGYRAKPESASPVCDKRQKKLTRHMRPRVLCT